MKKILCMVMLLMTGLLQQVYAQNRSLSGRVTDRGTGQGLPGATVLVKGTTVGASTNSDGSFSLSVPTTATTLTFSSIGYTSVDKPIGADATYDIALASDVKQLGEVVVTGLATSVKRSNSANAVAVVSAKDLVGSTRPVTLDAALNGKVIGANINATSGAPGGGISIQLRGVSSITGDNQPLYVIDGVYSISQEVGNGAGAASFTGASSGTTRTTQDGGTNRLSDLNPADIESIEILKGPSAAAIYGTRANAGVVIIRTKRGVAGQTRVSLSQDIGFAQVQRLLGHEDFTPLKIDLLRPYPDNATPKQIAAVNADRDEQKGLLADAQSTGKIFDYEKEAFGRTAFLRNTAVSVSGGNEKTKFYVSGSTTKEDGIVKNTGFERSSIRANVDQKIGNRIDLGLNSGYYRSTNKRGFFGNDNNGVSVGYNLISIPSYVDLHPNAVGVFPDSPFTGDNPLAVIARGINQESTDRVTEAATVNIRILENENSSLRLATQGGLDFASSNALLALPSDLQSQVSSPNPGVVRVAKNQFFNYNLQSFLIYDWKLGQDLNLTSQVGAVRLGLSSNLQFSQGQRLSPGPPYLPNRGSLVTQDVQLVDQVDVGYIAQQEANYRDQIIASVGVRFDKSSRNGDVNKLYAFPKASLAINLAKFDFLTIDKVNLVKLRVAYGETGGIPFFGGLYSPLINTSTGGRVGYYPSTVVGNANLKPERATELEAGIDLGFLDGRVGIEATVYNKKVFDIINTFALAPGTGVASQRAYPVGDLRNRGLEVALTVVPVRSTNFTWNSTTQFWLNRSEVTRLSDSPYKIPPFNLNPGFGASYGTNYFAVGESPTRWYGSPGAPDGGSKATNGLTRYGDAQPTFQMSYLNSFTIAKNFELSFLLHWKKDSYTSNLTISNQDPFGTSKDWSNPTTIIDPNTNKPYATLGLARQDANSDYYIQNSGFVRLREVSLYYSLPAAVRSSVFHDYVKNIRVGVSGNNIATWTNYRGYDPEISNFGTTNTGAQVDVVGYPSTKRFFFHLNLDF